MLKKGDKGYIFFSNHSTVIIYQNLTINDLRSEGESNLTHFLGILSS